jgi:hypothetical protein
MTPKENQMQPSRREFLDRLAMGSAALGGLSLGLTAVPARLEAAGIAAVRQGSWNVTWPDRLTGAVRTVFDVPEVESGYGVWRASVWAAQYEAALGIPVKDTSTALVLRHNAIVLAMKQEFWDRYGIGKDGSVMHPLTLEPTTRNPALLGEADGVPMPYANFALDRFQARGGVTLACDLALQDMIAIVQKADALGPDEARTRTLGYMVPGVILQPSGVFAVLLAQQKTQALYIRAS